MGFSATYASHVLEGLPSNPNESEFSHGPRKTVCDDVGGSIFLHFLLHVDGQKNRTFFPVPGCSFTHLLIGFSATYASHVLEGLPSKRNNSEFLHLPRSWYVGWLDGSLSMLGWDVGTDDGLNITTKARSSVYSSNNISAVTNSFASFTLQDPP